jgi:DNA processing protein
MLGDDEFAAWLRLLETPGVGRDSARRLLASFGSPEAVFSAPVAALRDVAGPALERALAVPPPEFDTRLAAALAWRRGGPDRHVLTLGDPAYPPLLLQTADPPLLLYLQGRPELLAERSLAVVGSRNPTVQGTDNARDFARALSHGGLVVVSGLALGIDGAAHEGALAAGPGGAGTIAVVGTGLDIAYPSRHRGLARQIAESGTLVSEFAPGTPPMAANFPQRNRIIAGLSLGTLVVEAALRSGSLITARMALEAGREVFAIPGSIHSPQSKGCHALIQQGAKLVQTAGDIVDELRGQRPAALPATDDESDAGDEDTPADPLLEALGHDPVTMDALQARTGWPTAELSARLLDLELDGRVARLPGGLFQRRTAT